MHNQIAVMSNKALSNLSNPVPEWRKLFKSPSEMEQGPIKFLVKDFLPEGICFIGGLSGCGKTWFALSLAKALCAGDKFLGHFEVPEPVPVIYLSPEIGERAFRSRLGKFGISDQRFLSLTMQDEAIKLTDERLLAAVRELSPVVFLDTAVRFLQGADENSASDSANGLAGRIFGLKGAGARAIVGLHHAPKATATKTEITLENILRGTGDFGAMADAVYGLKCMNTERLEIKVVCVKARDFESGLPFQIQGRPFFDDEGNFKLLSPPGSIQESETSAGSADVAKIAEIIKANPTASNRAVAKAAGIDRGRIRALAAMGGWERSGAGQDALWIPQNPSSGPETVN
jgi:hypothetical protein